MTDAPPSLSALLAAGQDVVALLNAHRGPFDLLIGLTFTRVTEDLLEAEVPVTEALTQPYGLVHGGVYASIVETLASAASALVALPRGQSTVGLENTTSFLRGTRGGKLTGRATPLTRGRRSQVWNVDVLDDDGRVVATGRVRTICLEAGATIGGETVAVKSGG
jgi:1,4-dihydroxy-2-naphthoyl-CoA hydrolase